MPFRAASTQLNKAKDERETASRYANQTQINGTSILSTLKKDTLSVSRVNNRISHPNRIFMRILSIAQNLIIPLNCKELSYLKMCPSYSTWIQVVPTYY